MKLSPVEQLRDTAARLSDEADGVRNRADAESREMTPEEKTQIADALAKFDTTMADIEAREAIDARKAKLALPQDRKVAPEAPARVTGGDFAGATSGSWGFRNTSEYFRAVMNAKAGMPDPRLVKNAIATYSGEGTNADGGYALPPDFRAGVQKLLSGPESLFAKLDQVQTPNYQVTMPIDEDPPWSTAGLLATTVAEAGPVTPHKPVLKTLAIPLVKYGDLVYVSEEMLADGTLIGPYVQSKAADKIAWKLNDAVFTAMLGSGSVITVAKTGGAAAGSAADLANLQKMYQSVYVNGYQNDCVFLANPAYITALQSIIIGTTWPVYLPAGGISNSPFSTLFGRPVIFTELCKAVGTEGDIMCVVPKAFYGVSKTDGVRSDISLHFAFDQDLVAYRFFIRAAAKSKHSTVVTRPDTTTASNVVTLATRA